ncbi:conjugal transfer protein TrbL family protein [Micromonospora sp. RP3T]|uniref:conjugal transfer protein TrbL family protein n=1 Tax=Micromonospora sp. RP3T TaxID=2135446 RepID=UPI001E3EBA79|nr:conjugal transfer protein TrbL family protein [Micromonospora sp. RP3T]
MNDLVRWLAERVIDLLGGLLAFLTSWIFVSPDVTGLPQVQSIAERSALVVDACFVLAIVAAGAAVMLGDSVETRYTVKQLVPRLVVGFVLSAFAVPLTGVLIEVANALTTSLAGVDAPTTEAVTFVKARLASAMGDPSSGLLMLIIGLLIVVLMFLLVGGWLTRIAALVVLAGVAPVALACHATPWTEGAAKLWWRSVLSCLATPTLQAVTFSAGINLVIDPQANLPILLGLPGSDTLNLLLVVVVLGMTVKIPSLVRRFTGQQGRSVGIGGVVLRTVALQGMARRLGGLRPAPARRMPLLSTTPVRPPYRHLPGVYPSPE